MESEQETLLGFVGNEGAVDDVAANTLEGLREAIRSVPSRHVLS
jgi:hypothetical protein